MTQLNELLQMAERHALNGRASAMDAFLTTAKIRANGSFQDILERVKEIERIGYEEAIPDLLRDAARFAIKKNYIIASICLDTAANYANKIGKDISMEETEIRDLCDSKNF